MRRLVPDSRPFSFVPSQKYRTWHITFDIDSYIFSEIQYQTKNPFSRFRTVPSIGNTKCSEIMFAYWKFQALKDITIVVTIGQWMAYNSKGRFSFYTTGTF